MFYSPYLVNWRTHFKQKLQALVIHKMINPKKKYVKQNKQNLSKKGAFFQIIGENRGNAFQYCRKFIIKYMQALAYILFSLYHHSKAVAPGH